MVVAEGEGRKACVCVWCEEMLTKVEDVDKSEALRLRPCQYIYMEGRTPYTTWDSWYPC